MPLCAVASSFVRMWPFQCSRRGLGSRTNRISFRVRLPGISTRMRLLLRHPGQVEQVAVLAELVVDVERVDLGRRAPDDGQRVGPELLHEPRAPRRQVVLQRPGRRRRRQHQHAHRRRNRLPVSSGPSSDLRRPVIVAVDRVKGSGSVSPGPQPPVPGPQSLDSDSARGPGCDSGRGPGDDPAANTDPVRTRRDGAAARPPGRGPGAVRRRPPRADAGAGRRRAAPGDRRGGPPARADAVHGLGARLPRRCRRRPRLRPDAACDVCRRRRP